MPASFVDDPPLLASAGARGTASASSSRGPSRGVRKALSAAAVLATATACATVGLLYLHSKVAPTTDAGSLQQSSGPGLVFSVDAAKGSALLSNGYLCLELVTGSVTRLAGDFNGGGNYGKNVLASGGITLQSEDGSGRVASSSSLGTSDVRFRVLRNDSSGLGLEVSGIRDVGSSGLRGHQAAAVEETWTFELLAGDRRLNFKAEGKVLQPGASFRGVRRQWEMIPSSIYALFEGGVVQMKAANPDADFYPSADHLLRLYSLGGSGSESGQVGNASLDLIFDGTSPGPAQNVIMSSSSGQPYWSGLQQVLAGGLPTSVLDKWMLGWAGSPAAALPNATWSHSVVIGVNNLDFPVATLPTAANLPQEDLHATMTGIYASPVGCLCTHQNEVEEGQKVAQIATSIARPDRGYSGTYNYFDPDNYISTAAMLWSNDAYLQQQVRAVIERSGSFLTDAGQLPHHFVGTKPVYQALSGEIQTGPNVFWILSAINYAKSSQDLDWLRSYMPTLRHASAFLFNLIDPVIHLANVPGSLMIDVFIRDHFTSDTNAQLVGFFREFAEAEEAVGNITGATSLRNLAQQISDSVNKYLWSPDQDHYVTQWNGPNESGGKVFRDFVDYDSNLMATAHGIPSAEQARAILKRVDGGRCRAGATFVSEKYYGPKDTTNGNIGDSWCSMGRIAWFDALSRKRYGDSTGFENYILQPLRHLLLSSTWMHERVACDGTPQLNRTAMYFEYPATVAMMVRAVKYGIDLGLGKVSIQPLGVSSFSYHVNDLNIDFSPAEVLVLMPGQGPIDFTVGPVSASSTFAVTSEGPGCSSAATTATSDASGLLLFKATLQRGCAVRATKV